MFSFRILVHDMLEHKLHTVRYSKGNWFSNGRKWVKFRFCSGINNLTHFICCSTFVIPRDLFIQCRERSVRDRDCSVVWLSEGGVWRFYCDWKVLLIVTLRTWLYIYSTQASANTQIMPVNTWSFRSSSGWWWKSISCIDSGVWGKLGLAIPHRQWMLSGIDYWHITSETGFIFIPMFDIIF